MMTYPEHIRVALEELSAKGFAYVIFTPNELQGADPETVMEEMVIKGWDAINYNKDPDDPDFNWEDDNEDYPN